jgi:DNA-binding HxlR family transcriptional regulator
MSSEPQRRADREVPLFTDPGDVLLSMQAVVGRKWQPVIVYHLLEAGPLGFSALKERTDGISSKMLSESLDDLEAAGLVAREVVSDKPVRVEYTLTEDGESLEGLVREMVSWGSRHIDDSAGEEAGLVLEGAQ